MSNRRPAEPRTFRSLAARCVQLKHDLGRAGLFRTMQKMEEVVQEVGYEQIDLIQADREIGESEGPRKPK